MKVIDRIGIERELFLLDENNKVVEPALYGFPFDEFGFLIEVRTMPHVNLPDLLIDYTHRHSAILKLAEEFNLHVECLHEKKLDKKFLDCLRKRYAYDSLKDTTANIRPNVISSHATGLNGLIGTAGLHIHFSRHVDIKRAQLPIYDICRDMDRRFSNVIRLSSRNFGEFEVKQHGFEYRSLPASITLSIPVQYAFELFKKYPYREVYY